MNTKKSAQASGDGHCRPVSCFNITVFHVHFPIYTDDKSKNNLATQNFFTSYFLDTVTAITNISIIFFMKNSSFFGKFAAVLPAGGLGKRMGGNIPKQLMLLGGKPVYQYSLDTFLKMDEIAEVVMAVPADWKDYFEKEIRAWISASGHDSNKLKIVLGGAERWQSVENGVNALASNAEYVLVHDVARPFVSEKIINAALK